MKCSTWPILIAVMVSSCGNSEIVYEIRSPGLREVVMAGTTSLTSQSSDAMRLLSAEGVRAGVVSIYGSRDELLTAGPRGFTNCDFEDWRQNVRMFEREGRLTQCPVVTQIFKLGTGIVRRHIDRACRSHLTILQGQNPLLVEIDRARYEIVDVRATGAAPPSAPGIKFFVSTREPVSIDAARRLLKHFQEITGLSRLYVSLRADRWFAFDCDFPLLSSIYGPNASLPNEREFSQSTQANCGLDPPWPMQCLEMGNEMRKRPLR